jgi:hypothetical protein
MTMFQKGDRVLSQAGAGFWHSGHVGVVMQVAPRVVVVNFCKGVGRGKRGRRSPEGDETELFQVHGAPHPHISHVSLLSSVARDGQREFLELPPGYYEAITEFADGESVENCKKWAIRP